MADGTGDADGRGSGVTGSVTATRGVGEALAGVGVEVGALLPSVSPGEGADPEATVVHETTAARESTPRACRSGALTRGGRFHGNT